MSQAVNHTIQGPVRALVHPSVKQFNARPGPVDVLFLYRSPKKHNYFCQVAGRALPGWHCAVASYHNLPAAPACELAPQTLGQLQAYAEQELFSARDTHWIKHFRAPLMALRTTQIKKIYPRLVQLLNQYQPRLIVVWNGSKFQDHILRAANHRKAPIACFENGVLPGSTTLDLKGINAAGSIPKNRNFYRTRPERTYRLAPVQDRKPRVARKKAATASAGPRASGRGFKILIPFQKERDTQILHHSPWIKSMPQLFYNVYMAARLAGIDAELIFREHPSSATSYPQLHQRAGELARARFDNHTPIAEALADADAVVTINSSVGMEALIAGKKVITLGEAFYNIDGLVQNAISVDALKIALQNLPRFLPDEVLKHQFLEFLANDYVVPEDWRKPGETHFQALSRRFSAMLRAGKALPDAEPLLNHG